MLGHQSGAWLFPKGHIDPGETDLSAALREVEEESGVVAQLADEALRDETSYVNAAGRKRHIIWFLLVTEAETPVLREKLFPDGAFLDPSEALAQLSYAEDRALLSRMLAHYRRLRHTSAAEQA